MVHITNGDSLTSRLNKLGYKGTIITWREALCQGPTCVKVFSPEFVSTRIAHLSKRHKDMETSYAEFVDQFGNMDGWKDSPICLWFEYDLFCHVNLAATISLLLQYDIKSPMYLVCSGTIPNDTRLYGLAELSEAQIHQHYEHKVLLSETDKKTLHQFWELYNDGDHSLMLELNTESTQLSYLRNCIHAQLQRFPERNTGLNSLEYQVLEHIRDHEFPSKRHLIGAILRDQGYYGFGDVQIEALIENISLLFSKANGILKLTQSGEEILEAKNNAYEYVKNDTQFGGALKYDYFYNSEENRLIKAHENS